MNGALQMDVWFYQLRGRSLEQTLPALLERTLARPWRAMVEVGTPERLAALDDHLWTYADDAFLPHGTDAEPSPDQHPIVLTQSRRNLNGAETRFLVDGARWHADHAGYERMMLIFDGTDPDALDAARADWKAARAAGQPVTFWQQDDQGGWSRKS